MNFLHQLCFFEVNLFTVKLVEEEVLVDLLQLYPTPLFFCMFLVKFYLFSMPTDSTSVLPFLKYKEVIMQPTATILESKFDRLFYFLFLMKFHTSV